ncbi:hypothetical protein MMC19_003161 [Ptychographa xylographoides]|nr:hypothetical protein [Ptychographa xylographoides]
MPSHPANSHRLVPQDLSNKHELSSLYMKRRQMLDVGLATSSMASETNISPRSYYSSIQKFQPATMTTLHESPPHWMGSRESPSYQRSHPALNQFYSNPPHDVSAWKGETLQETQWTRELPHGQSLLCSQMPGSLAFPSDENGSMETIMGSSAHNRFSAQLSPSPTYFFEAVNDHSNSSLPSPRYRPFSSGIPITPHQMDATSQAYDPFEYLPKAAFDRSFSSSIEQENRLLSPRDFSQHHKQKTFSPADHVEETDGELNSEPYAQLIYRALKSVPGHRMVLKEIYEWFERNTEKAKNNSSKGWQNSIRHNLSMNGAFKKVDHLPPTDDGKKGFVWVLDPSALEKGVESTTRYRKAGSSRKIGRTEPAAAQRQRSGAKGGKAAKKAARFRRSPRYEASGRTHDVDELFQETKLSIISYEEGLPTLDTDLFDLSTPPYYTIYTPSSTVQSSIADTNPYHFEHITGCTDILEKNLLHYGSYDTGGREQTLTGHSLCDSVNHMQRCEFDLSTQNTELENNMTPRW